VTDEHSEEDRTHDGDAPADDGILPGRVRPRPTPTTAAERWIEVVEVSHEGLAVLDADYRFEFVSDRTATALGSTGEALLGIDFTDIVTELTEAELATIESSKDTGDPVRLICTRRGSDGWIRALRLTFVPRRGDDGARGRMIVLSHDITPLRVMQDQRRRAQHRLTAVEEEEQRRIRREVHDGPIQILAALALRLGMTTANGIELGDLRDLELAVDSASRELREILTAPTPAVEDTPENLLVQWAAPLIDGSILRLEIEDRCAGPPNRATTEALFVFLHETIKEALAFGAPRTILAVLTNESDGYRLVLTVPQNTDERITVENEQEHVGAAERYAALLGGSFEQKYVAPGVRLVTAFLPQLDEQGWAAATQRDEDPPAMTGPWQENHVDRAGYAMLSDADREATAQASYQGLMELDADLRVTFVNESYAHAFGRPAGELVGMAFKELFHPSDFERVRAHVEQVQRGVPVRFEWRRRNNAGEARWTQVAGSPRFDSEGRFDGALMMTIDTTTLHLAEDLRDAVLIDLDRARRAARRRTAQRLDDGPIQRLEGVNDRLRNLIVTTEPSDLIRVIQRELERSIAALQSSVDRLTDPDLTAVTWDDALRTSLAAQFPAERIELVIDDRTEQAPSGEKAEVLVKIAREAIVNAVRHGHAGRVDVQLEDSGGDNYRIQVVDDGVGADPESLRPAPGHLRTRWMAERAAEQHGSFAVAPRPGGGTIVTVSIPRADDTIVAT
jgi:PAS domain S-box-containing protein